MLDPKPARRLHPRSGRGRSAPTAVLILALCAGTSMTVQAQTTPAGRLLASNCFQCHGTNGAGPGFATLTGRSAKEIYEKLVSFASGKEGTGLMAKHAMGYTDAQMQSLSAWLATQK
jgi:cytochrome c553